MADEPGEEGSSDPVVVFEEVQEKEDPLEEEKPPKEPPALQEEPEEIPAETATAATDATPREAPEDVPPASETVALQGLAETKDEAPAVLKNDEPPLVLDERESFESFTTTNATAKSVSEARKKALLLQARLDRLAWIDPVHLPMTQTTGSVWGRDSRLQAIHAAAANLPGALPVLEHLYGMSYDNNDNTTVSSSAVADRIQSVLGSDPHFQQESQPTGEQILQMSLKKEQSAALQAYHEFWNKLRDPASAMLVQGMRRFCRGMKDTSDRETMAATLKSYLGSTYSSIKSHILWKDKGGDEGVRRSLESFIYGQCHECIESVLWNDEAKEMDKTWLDKLASLQFVGPKHLEIACFDTAADTSELLKGPLEALHSVNAYFSPYEKLQRILAVYHGVNAALADALNRNRGGEKKLPSADDVLPTIIYLVLQGRPARLHYDLGLVEDFCPAEYLRGEAGYAFTNLYGAVQFLHNLNMNEPQSLSMGAEEFNKGLAASRLAMEGRLEASQQQPKVIDSVDDDDDTLPPSASVHISAHHVRDAQRNGQTVDLDWALQHHLEQLKSQEGSIAAPAGVSIQQQRQQSQESTEANHDGTMPVGYARSYTYLTTKPEDVKVTDLPHLLAEYRMLVHTTERLLGERVSRAATKRKTHMSAVEDEIRTREQALRDNK